MPDTKPSLEDPFFSLLSACELEGAKVELERSGTNFTLEEQVYRRLLLLAHQGRYQEAYQLAQSHPQRDNPLFRFYWGRVAIGAGHWLQGLDLMDSVRGHGIFGGPFLTSKAPLWSREPLMGKTLVITSEGGLGDAVCFSRFAPNFQKLGASVILATYPELFPLFRSLPGRPFLVDIEAIDQIDFDYWIPALSVPRLLQLEPEGISGAPFLDGAGMEPQFSLSPEEPQVGLHWSGNPEFAEDHLRSIPGGLFKELVEKQEHIHFSSPSSSEGKFSFSHPRIQNVTGGIGDPQDLARYLKGLDLFISVDSGPAHLAAALGTPTLLLNRVMGWITFGLSPETSNPQKSFFYGSMTILHQQQWGHWETMPRRVNQFLDQWQPPPRRGRKKTIDELYHPDKPSPEVGIADFCETREGPMLTLPNDFYVGKALRFYGEYSQKEVEIYQNLIEPGDVVVEGGAHLGAFTRVFSRLVGPEGHVYAFEPQKLLYRTNLCNTALASHANVTLTRAGLSEESGFVDVPEMDFGKVGNSGGLSLSSESQSVNAGGIPLIPLDSLNLTRLDFLKLDIEGMELLALRGAIKTLRRFQPLIFCEVDRKENKADILQFLTDLGYVCEEQNTFLFHSENFNGEKTNIYENKMSFNLLAKPSRPS